MRRALFVLSAAVALWCAPGALASGWCGSGEAASDRPDAVTGRQVHVIYAVPSDGADTFATGAAKLADDVASITIWWQGQDATRVPRWDTAAFPAGTCLDISFVRLAGPSSAYAGVGANPAFSRVESDLAKAGFLDPFVKYLVYFDGPSVQTDVCGTGAGDFGDGPGYAVVWLAGCPSVPDDSVAAHELLHAFGALPFGAPHACPGDTGHPCDSTLDVLYPYNSGAPLSSLYLDWNHDDYYGHPGSWVDIQDSPWLHRLDLPQVTLAVGIVGGGTIVSDVPGVACSVTCTTSWDPNTGVTLSAQPAAGSRFVRWSGGCTGSGDCALGLAVSTSVTALFGPTRIPVHVGVAGKGRVSCTPECSSSFAAGRPLTLVATPAKGWKFAGWTGACKGTRPVCRPATDFAVTARATFRKR